MTPDAVLVKKLLYVAGGELDFSAVIGNRQNVFGESSINIQILLVGKIKGKTNVLMRGHSQNRG